jgi:hypothetical protein
VEAHEEVRLTDPAEGGGAIGDRCTRRDAIELRDGEVLADAGAGRKLRVVEYMRQLVCDRLQRGHEEDKRSTKRIFAVYGVGRGGYGAGNASRAEEVSSIAKTR